MTIPASPTGFHTKSGTPSAQDLAKRANARGFIMGMIAAIVEATDGKPEAERFPITSGDVTAGLPTGTDRAFADRMAPWRLESTTGTALLLTWTETGEQEVLPTDLTTANPKKPSPAILRIVRQGVPRTH